MLLEFKSAGARFVLQWVFFSVFSSPPMHLVLFTTFIQLQAHTQVHSGLQMDDCTLFTRKIRVLEVQRYIRSVCLWTRLRVALSVQGKLLTVVLRVANNCTQAKVLLVCKNKYLSTRNNTHHKNKQKQNYLTATDQLWARHIGSLVILIVRQIYTVYNLFFLIPHLFMRLLPMDK